MKDEDELRRRLHEVDSQVHTPPAHDAAILASARAAAESIRQRKAGSSNRRNWFIPVSLAASFAFGMLAMRLLETTGIAEGTPGVELVIPLDATRGGSGRSIPVEQASPEDWYRYIQELTAAGQAREAEQHLQRFNELHPDFVYQP